MAQSSRISLQQFLCPAEHKFGCWVLASSSDTNNSSVQFKPAGTHRWIAVPKCPEPDCLFLGELEADVIHAGGFVQVPESQRFEAWMAPDGSSLPVPGRKGAPMPERYRKAGYIKVEARTVGDLDRFDRIRSLQTGNTAYHEMNFSAARRREREDADYNDDMTSDV